MSTPGGFLGGSADPDLNQGLEDTISSTSDNVGYLVSKVINVPCNTGTLFNETNSSSENVINNNERSSTNTREIILDNNEFYVNPSIPNSNSTTNISPKRNLVDVIDNFSLESGTQNQTSSNVTESFVRSAASNLENGVNNDLLKEVSSKVVTVHNDSIVVEPGPSKRRKVDIFIEDTGPKWYDAQGSNITQTIDPTKLPEAFNFLPIHGRPKNKEELPEFQLKKIKEFVGSGLNDEEFLKLKQYCSPEHLKTGTEMITAEQVPNQGIVPYEVDFEPFSNTDPSTSNAGDELCVVKKFKMRLEKDATNAYAKKLKYRGLRMMPLTSEGDVPTVTLGMHRPLEPGRDILFRVRIYRPFPYNIKDKPNRIRHSVFSRDVVLLGRQKLSELRDRIVCANDMDMRLDVSERVDDPPTTTARELFPSGFMFINNVFYVDTRPGCTDLTERLWQWARHKPGLGDFPRRDMCITTLDQLRVKLGHPEVYVHQGNCEHLFTFSEIRLLGPSDPLRVSHYPCHTAMSQNQTVYCTTCAEFGAKWIVTGCARVPFDPAFFCENCLKLFLYVDNRKVDDFKVYSFRGNEINMLKPQG